MVALQEPNLNHSFHNVWSALDDNQISTAHKYTNMFEKRLSTYLGGKKVIATNTGTAALHLALRCAGIGPGDEVIIPVTTFAATANAVRYVGANPRFVDVDPKTWTLNPKDLPHVIRHNTKAIIWVHLYGVPCQMDVDNDFIHIEDCAESLGATYNGIQTGLWGDYGCYSFNGNKLITCGAGGAVTTHHSITQLDYYSRICKEFDGTFGDVGFNYRMPSFNAALGLDQFEQIDYFLEKKRRFNQIYREELSFYRGIVFQDCELTSNPSWWMSACTFDIDPIDLIPLQMALEKKGVKARRIFRPLTDSPPYKHDGFYRVAHDIYDRGLCLPSSTLNKEGDILEVCRIVKSLL